MRRRCLFLPCRHTYQRPIDPINLIQKSAAFMKQLQRISAQALYIGNGCADLLNCFPIFHRYRNPRLELRAPASLYGLFAGPSFPA